MPHSDYIKKLRTIENKKNFSLCDRDNLLYGFSTKSYRNRIALLSHVTDILQSEVKPYRWQKTVTSAPFERYFTNSKIACIPACSRYIIPIGDIHADSLSLEIQLRSSHFFETLSLKPENHLIILGDFIDIGFNLWRTIDMLCIIKIAFPRQVTILLGNHEKRQSIIKKRQNRNHLECLIKDNPDSADFLKCFHEFSEALPRMAISQDGAIYVHGGAPVIHDKHLFAKSGMSYIAAHPHILENVAFADICPTDDAIPEGARRAHRKQFIVTNKKTHTFFKDIVGARTIIRSHDRTHKRRKPLWNCVYTVYGSDYRSLEHGYDYRERIKMRCIKTWPDTSRKPVIQTFINELFYDLHKKIWRARIRYMTKHRLETTSLWLPLILRLAHILAFTEGAMQAKALAWLRTSVQKGTTKDFYVWFMQLQAYISTNALHPVETIFKNASDYTTKHPFIPDDL